MDATDEHRFGVLLDNNGDENEFQLVTIVPIKLELKEP